MADTTTPAPNLWTQFQTGLGNLLNGTGSNDAKTLALLGFGLTSLIENQNRTPDPIKVPQYNPAPVYNRALTGPMTVSNSLGSKLYFNPQPFNFDPATAGNQYGPTPQALQEAADAYRQGVASLYTNMPTRRINPATTEGKMFASETLARTGQLPTMAAMLQNSYNNPPPQGGRPTIPGGGDPYTPPTTGGGGTTTGGGGTTGGGTTPTTTPFRFNVAEAQKYFAANPDVEQAYYERNYGMSPADFASSHYNLWGADEERANPSGTTVDPFNAIQTSLYFAQNPDVKTAYQEKDWGMTPEELATYHYNTFGSGEQRALPSGTFDQAMADQYFALYPDVRQGYETWGVNNGYAGDPVRFAQDHYNNHGRKDQRLLPGMTTFFAQGGAVGLGGLRAFAEGGATTPEISLAQFKSMLQSTGMPEETLTRMWEQSYGGATPVDVITPEFRAASQARNQYTPSSQPNMSSYKFDTVQANKYLRENPAAKAAWDAREGKYTPEQFLQWATDHWLNNSSNWRPPAGNFAGAMPAGVQAQSVQAQRDQNDFNTRYANNSMIQYRDNLARMRGDEAYRRSQVAEANNLKRDAGKVYSKMASQVPGYDDRAWTDFQRYGDMQVADPKRGSGFYYNPKDYLTQTYGTTDRNAFLTQAGLPSMPYTTGGAQGNIGQYTNYLAGLRALAGSNGVDASPQAMQGWSRADYDPQWGARFSGASPATAAAPGIMGALSTHSQNAPQVMPGTGRASPTPNYMQYNNGRWSYASGGAVAGPGDGVSDSIPATINGAQPARLADGEYVLPAHFVSAIGNGSTRAGVEQIQNMVDRVMSAKYGTSNPTPRPLNPRAFLG